MFPPTTPTTERIRIENEKREFELNVARRSRMTPSQPRFQIRWSLLGRIGQLTSTVAAALSRPTAHPPVRQTQTQPPACCPE